MIRAAQQLEPARLSWGTGVIHFAMNRREFTPTGVILPITDGGPGAWQVMTPCARTTTLANGSFVITWSTSTYP